MSDQVPEVVRLSALAASIRQRLTDAGAEFMTIGQGLGKVRIYLRGRNQDRYIEGFIAANERPYVTFEKI